MRFIIFIILNLTIINANYELLRIRNAILHLFSFKTPILYENL